MSCPICSKPTEKAYRPFCSKRCANVDLGRWLNEDYAIPATDEEPPELPTDPDTPQRPH